MHFLKHALPIALLMLLQLSVGAFLVGETAIGTADYPNGGLARASNINLIKEGMFLCSAYDPQHAIAYFGSYFGEIIVVRQNAGTTAPEIIGSVQLGERVDVLLCDAAAGYLYAVTYASSSPAKLHKLVLANAQHTAYRLNSIALNTDEIYIKAAALDATRGYAYLAVNTFGTPGSVIKIALGTGDAAPQRLGALALNSGEAQIQCAAIDTTAGYAYFGTGTSPGIIVKVTLGSGNALPTRVGALTLAGGQNNLLGALLDPAAGYGYFSTGTSPSYIAKVNLGGSGVPTASGALWLGSLGLTGKNYMRPLAIDPAASKAWFVSEATPVLSKFNLGAGSAAPTLASEISLSSDYGTLTGVFDAATYQLLLGTYDSIAPQRVIKVAAGSGSTAPTRLSAVNTAMPLYNVQCAALDTVNRTLVLGDYAGPANLKRVGLTPGNLKPDRSGPVLGLNAGETNATLLALDLTNGVGYVNTDFNDQLTKFSLGGLTAPFQHLSTLSYPTYYDNASAMLPDNAGYAYVFTTYGGYRLLKIRANPGNSAPTLVGSLDLAEYIEAAVIDPVSRHLYAYGNYQIIKFALGVGDALPSEVSRVTLPFEVNGSYDKAMINLTTGHAFFAANYNPGRIVKVGLGDGDAAPYYCGYLDLDKPYVRALDLYPDGNSLAAVSASGRVYRVSCGAGDAAPAVLGSLDMLPGETDFRTLNIDPHEHYAYVCTYDTENLIKVNLSQRNLVKGLRIELTSHTVVNGFRLYSLQSDGAVRLGLYSAGTTSRTLLWDSGLLTNTTQTNWIDLATSAGTPAKLRLAPGTYYLAWKLDSFKDVPALVPGTLGDGFTAFADGAALPPSLHAYDPATSWTTTSNRWSMHLYGAAAPVARLAQSVIQFGMQNTDAGPSSAQAVELRNDGSAPLVFGSMGAQFPDSTEFNFASPPDLSPINPGESRQFSICFDPDPPNGPRAATLRFSTSDPVNSQLDVALNASAVPAELSLFDAD
jgi:hypothetical protein